MSTDILNGNIRRDIINEILNQENVDRKQESFRRFEIYKNRQREQIIQRLQGEFSAQTVREMRILTSINLCKRIVDEKASIYKKGPERSFTNASEQQEEQLRRLYSWANVDVQMKRSNKYKVFNDQCALKVLPKNGMIEVKPMLTHHYDVVPMSDDPEKADVYILNVFDKTEQMSDRNQAGSMQDIPTGSTNKVSFDGHNQSIADKEDYKQLTGRLIFWSRDWHFQTNNKGHIIDPRTGFPVTNPDSQFLEMIRNPIGALPFIDIASEKDFEFFVRKSNNVAEFSIDYGLLLSDLANIIRLQGYSQAVISAEEVPVDMRVGPHRILHLPLNEDRAVQPSFQFVSPSPDLANSLEFLQSTLTTFLTSEGLDPKTVGANVDGKRFSSGLERLLSMIEKFEASQDDIDIFRGAELDLFDLIRSWNNWAQDAVNIKDGKPVFMDELKGTTISDDVELNIQFQKPQMVQTKAELEDSVIKQMENGLITKKEALMKLRDIDEDKAQEILEEIQEEEFGGFKVPE